MGTPLETYAGETSEKSRGVALALVTLLGVFGGHRFYVGKTGTGILQAVTLGGAGLWWLYDLIPGGERLFQRCERSAGPPVGPRGGGCGRNASV
jgi:TM2 domain-containing membrane protein YozV